MAPLNQYPLPIACLSLKAQGEGEQYGEDIVS